MRVEEIGGIKAEAGRIKGEEQKKKKSHEYKSKKKNKTSSRGGEKIDAGQGVLSRD